MAKASTITSPSYPSEHSSTSQRYHPTQEDDYIDDMIQPPPQSQSPAVDSPILHRGGDGGIDHIHDDINPYACQHRCDHSSALTSTNPLSTLSSRSTSHSSGLNEKLPDTLSLHDDTEHDISNVTSPDQLSRQRSGFADVSHLVQHKIAVRKNSLSRARSERLPDELSTDDIPIDRDILDSASIAMPDPPRRQKSGYEIIKEKLRRFTTGGSTAVSSDDEGSGNGYTSGSGPSSPIKCEKCEKGKPCAVHKSSTKKKQLMKTRKQGAFRRLPGFG